MRAKTNLTLISALLSKAPMYSADLFTVSLLDGQSFYWTSADRDIAWSGTTWSAVGPAIQRSAWGAKNTTEVPELTIQLFSTGADFTLGNIKALMHDGLLDGAYVQLDRAFMPTYGDTALGIVTLFGGRVGKIEVQSIGAKLTVVASNVLLQQNMPRNTYQTGCIHTLYDTGCTLVRSAHTTSYTVTTANNLALNYSGAPSDPSVYQLGVAAITSGLGVGQRRAIDASNSTGVTLAYPLLTVPAPGDTFTLTEGCDKSTARCTALSNIANFRGFPAIPIAELGI
jgi:uncharacterized phage protein (TIGR02218 family)